jgi:hypothetical protein
VQEYNHRLAYEVTKKNYLLDLLNQRRRDVEEEFREYERSMDAELATSLTYLRGLEGKQWDRDESQEAVNMWRQRLGELEAETAAAQKEHARMSVEGEKKRFVSHAKMINFNHKLYEISLARPDLWRAMKARELAQVCAQTTHTQCTHPLAHAIHFAPTHSLGTHR